MQLESIAVNQISPSPFQPREAFPKAGIQELANSIKEHGLLEPIILREHGGGYQIVCGERRWRAGQFAGLNEIDAIVKDVSDDQLLVESLIENIHREDLTSVERENAIHALWDTGNYSSYQQLSRELGYSSEARVSGVLKAREFRHKANVPPEVSTTTLRETAGLDDAIRKKVIEKVASRDLAPTKVPDYARTLKQAPEPLREAIVDDKVDAEDVKPLLDVGIPKDLVQPAVEELSERKRERDLARQLDTDRDISIVRGELKSRGVSIQPTPDEKKLKRFVDIRDQMKWWSVSTIMQIEDDRIRQDVIGCIRDMEQSCSKLLAALEKRV